MDDYHVLIIDDDKDAAAFFSSVLSLVGFKCKLVHSGRDAFAHLAAYQPDMVLLDMYLGKEITGEDILYLIRTNPRFEKTKIIITTAHPGMAQPITDLADLTLLKPIAMEQLQAFAERLAIAQPTSRQYLFRDPITSLFNREFFLNRLEHAYERAKRRMDFLFAVLTFTIEIDALDNEPFIQDVVMCQLARQFASFFRPTDTFARLDGKHFASLHEELKKPEDLDVLVERLHQAITQTVVIGERCFVTHVHIGAVLHEQRYTHAEDMLAAAEAALAQSHPPAAN